NSQESGSRASGGPRKAGVNRRTHDGKSPKQNPQFDSRDGEKTAEENQNHRVETAIGREQQEGGANLREIHGHIDIGDVAHALPGGARPRRTRRSWSRGS